MGDVMAATTQRKRVADLVEGDVIVDLHDELLVYPEWHRWSNGRVSALNDHGSIRSFACDECTRVVVPEPDYEGFVKELIHGFGYFGDHIPKVHDLCDKYHIPLGDV